MTGDCHVRFCERLRGETPLCLLGGFARRIFFSQSLSARLPTVGRLLLILILDTRYLLLFSNVECPTLSEEWRSGHS
jgi:hypothetical protein